MKESALHSFLWSLLCWLHTELTSCEMQLLQGFLLFCFFVVLFFLSYFNNMVYKSNQCKKNNFAKSLSLKFIEIIEKHRLCNFEQELCEQAFRAVTVSLSCQKTHTSCLCLFFPQRTYSHQGSLTSTWALSWKLWSELEQPPCCVLPVAPLTQKSPGTKTSCPSIPVQVTAASNSYAQVRKSREQVVTVDLLTNSSTSFSTCSSCSAQSVWCLAGNAAVMCVISFFFYRLYNEMKAVNYSWRALQQCYIL